MSTPSLSTTLLVPSDRVPRLPLDAWADALVDALDRYGASIRRPRVLAARVAEVANNAALVATHAGDTDRARALCVAHLHWQARLSRRSRDPAIAALAIQPWVNLGRLDAHAGDCESALARFAALRPQSDRAAIRLGTVIVGADAWRAVAPDATAHCRVVEMTYVTDSLRALLMNRRFTEAHTLAHVLSRRSVWPGATLTAIEADVVAMANVGEPLGAADLAAIAVHGADPWSRAVLRLREAEARACAGDTATAAARLRPLVDALRHARVVGTRDVHRAVVLLRVGECALGLGLPPDVALPLTRAAHDRAVARDDEVLRIECLRVLARHEPAPDTRARSRDALDALETSTGYVRYRRRGAARSDRVAASLDVLHAQLDRFLT